MHELTGHQNQQPMTPVVSELLRTLTHVTTSGYSFPLDDSLLIDAVHETQEKSSLDSLIIGRRNTLTTELGTRLLQLVISVHNEALGQLSTSESNASESSSLGIIEVLLGTGTTQDDDFFKFKEIHLWGIVNVLMDGTIPVVGEYNPQLCNDEDLALAEEIGIAIDPTTVPLGEHGWTPLVYVYDEFAVATLSETIRYMYDQSK